MLKIELQDNEYPFEYIDEHRNVVRAIIYDDEGYFYFARIHRDDIFAKDAEFIETSGGGVEQGEDLITAIKRELKEELGMEVEVKEQIGIVSDYYNLINRHNINNYFLCKKISIGDNHLTKEEANIFHLTMLKIKYDDAVKEYERCAVNGLGRLIRNRELPILKEAYEILKTMDNA